MINVSLGELKRRQAMGHKYIQVVVTRSRRPRGRRVRVCPGVLGTLIGCTNEMCGEYLVDVPIADLLVVHPTEHVKDER